MKKNPGWCRPFAGLLIFAVCSAIQSADCFAKDPTVEESTKVYSELEEEWREKAIAEWKRQIESVEKRLKELPKEKFPANLVDSYGKRITPEQLRARTKKELTARLAELRKNDPPLFPSIVQPGTGLAKGNWGTFQANGNPGHVKVIQVLKDRLLCTCGETFILEGMSTDGVVDGKSFEVPGLFVVAGTESYASVAGATKTVFVVRPLPRTKAP